MTEDSQSERRAGQLVILIALIGAIIFLAGIAPLIGGTDSLEPRTPFETDTGESVGDVVGGPSQIVSAGETSPVGGTTTHLADVDEEIVHFQADTPEQTYWRLDAYSEYDQGTWEHAGSPVSGPWGDPWTDENATEEIEQSVLLHRPAEGIPGAPHPTTMRIDGEVPSGLESTREGGLIHADGVEQGTRYQVNSIRIDTEADTLREISSENGSVTSEGSSSLTDDAISLPWETHTDEPEELPDRVTELTDNITADTDNWYDAATAIESWIKENHEYTVEAAHEPGEDPVDYFLFEMDAAYCQYAASAMAVMLQTQDIPARYTVGYSPGEYIGDGTYEITSQDAHAWVEVYFPEYGWQKFDPTPSGEVPAEWGQPDNDSDPIDPTPAPPNGSNDNYEVLFSDTFPEPGDTVTVTVTQNGSPSDDRPVQIIDNVNNETFWTDENGEFEYPVPITDSITIQVLEDGTLDDEYTGEADSSVDPGEITGLDSTPDEPGTSIDDLADPAYEENRAINASLSIVPGSDPMVAGGQTQLTALFNNEPVSGVNITVDGDTVGSTNEDGELTYTAPADVDGNLTIAGTIGAISSTEEITAGPIVIETDHQFWIPLPGMETTVSATVSGESAAGGTLTQDGEVVGMLGPDGTATTELPISDTGMFAVEYGGQEQEYRTDGMYLNAGIAGGVVTVALVLFGGLLRRYWDALGQMADRTASGIEQGISRFLSLTAMMTGRLMNRIPGTDSLASQTRDFRQLGSQIIRVANPVELLAWIVGAVMGTLDERFGSSRQTVDDGMIVTPTTERSARGTVNRTIRSAWQTFLRVVGVDRPETKTPSEIAQTAIESGLPEAPVRRLTETFRAAEYGGESNEQQAKQATEVVNQLKNQESSNVDASRDK